MKTNLILLSLILLTLSAFGQINPDDNVVVQMNQALVQAIQNSGFAPTTSTRAAAILNTAMYNAWVPYDSKALPAEVTEFTRQPEADRTDENKKAAAAYAGYNVLSTLLPSEQALFDEVMANNNFDIADIPTDTSTAAGLGTAAGMALMKLKEDDNSNQLGNLNPSGVPYSEPILLEGYEPYEYVNTVDKVNNVNNWQPQALPDGGSQEYLTPHWGLVKAFALEDNAEFRPSPPYVSADGEVFEQQAWNVYNISQSLTDRQKLIASYWAGVNNITNPIGFLTVALDVSARDQQSLDEDVKMFFAVSNAISDSHIATFEDKRAYNSVRPITQIKEQIDKEWEPYLSTPNFPEYTSAHSGTGAAPAFVLQRFKNSNVYNGSYTDPATGITLNWPTFTDAADEMGYSRLYAGVHYDLGDLNGRELGRQVGAVVWDKAYNLMEGIVEEETGEEGNVEEGGVDEGAE